MKPLNPTYVPPASWRTESQARRLEGEAWQTIRQHILQRDNFMCAYCGYRAKKFQIVDHIDGNSENNADDNLQVVCQMCNCVKHSGQGCVVKGVVDLYRNSWFNQNNLIILTRFLRDLGKHDDEIRTLLGLQKTVAFKMDHEYLMPLFAFVTSRSTVAGDDMYDKWRNYHERVLRPKHREEDILIELKLLDAGELGALHEQVKANVLAYIPQLVDHQDKPIAELLIKAGVFKRIRKQAFSTNSRFKKLATVLDSTPNHR